MTRLVALLLVVGGATSCLRPCRGIDVQSLPVACEERSLFSGEIHLGDPVTFQTFLELECMPAADAETIADLVAAVDFTQDAVFVAANDRAQVARCIESREPDGVEVCADGLRVPFADRISDADPCLGKWTVAFALPRDELRAATGAGEAPLAPDGSTVEED